MKNIIIYGPVFCSVFIYVCGLYELQQHDLKGPETKELVNLNGSFYYFSPDDVMYIVTDAVRVCNDIGMKILSIQSEEKQNMIAEYITQKGPEKRRYWLSGMRYYEDTYIWTGTGEIITYNNYWTYFPTLSYSTPEVCLFYDYDHTWLDDYCNWYYGVICEQ